MHWAAATWLTDYTLVKSSWIGVTKFVHKEGIIVDLCQPLALFLNFFSNCGSVLFSGGRQSVRRTTVCVFDDNGQAGWMKWKETKETAENKVTAQSIAVRRLLRRHGAIFSLSALINLGVVFIFKVFLSIYFGSKSASYFKLHLCQETISADCQRWWKALSWELSFWYVPYS